MLRAAAVLISGLAVLGHAAAASPPALDFTAETIDGETVGLARYAGHALLVANVASECAQTPQLAALQALDDRYRDKGLRVLAFPSNDFGGQSTGTNAEIKALCLRQYGVAFDLFAKTPVSGAQAHPFYRFLTSEQTNPRFFGTVDGDFEKFLLDRDGRVVNRFRTDVPPDDPDVIAAIEWALLDHGARAAALDHGKGPPALREYRGREIAQTMHWQGAPWLLRAMREDEEKASVMLGKLGLKPGMHVADIGAGNGFHTVQMARAIAPDGIAYAVDVQPEMLRMLDARAAAEKVANIRTIENRYWDAGLPESSVDLALLVDVYHEFSHPEEMLASIRRSLRPGGRVALVEFRTEDPEVPIKKLHKMSKAQILRELPANGFRLVGSFDGLPWQHLMFFESTGDPSADSPGSPDSPTTREPEP